MAVIPIEAGAKETQRLDALIATMTRAAEANTDEAGDGEQASPLIIAACAIMMGAHYGGGVVAGVVDDDHASVDGIWTELRRNFVFGIAWGKSCAERAAMGGGNVH